jgi:hypothetical protein
MVCKTQAQMRVELLHPIMMILLAYHSAMIMVQWAINHYLNQARLYIETKEDILNS